MSAGEGLSFFTWAISGYPSQAKSRAPCPWLGPKSKPTSFIKKSPWLRPRYPQRGPFLSTTTAATLTEPPPVAWATVPACPQTRSLQPLATWCEWPFYNISQAIPSLLKPPHNTPSKCPGPLWPAGLIPSLTSWPTSLPYLTKRLTLASLEFLCVPSTLPPQDMVIPPALDFTQWLWLCACEPSFQSTQPACLAKIVVSCPTQLRPSTLPVSTALGMFLLGVTYPPGWFLTGAVSLCSRLTPRGQVLR